jgi:hypothetical protein
MAILESDWQTFNNVASAKPQTIVSAATIAPTSYLTILTGNTAVATITPPLPNQTHTVALQFAGTAGTLATGNILTAIATVASQVTLFVYNPATGKYAAVT